MAASPCREVYYSGVAAVLTLKPCSYCRGQQQCGKHRAALEPDALHDASGGDWVFHLLQGKLTTSDLFHLFCDPTSCCRGASCSRLALDWQRTGHSAANLLPDKQLSKFLYNTGCQQRQFAGFMQAEGTGWVKAEDDSDSMGGSVTMLHVANGQL